MTPSSSSSSSSSSSNSSRQRANAFLGSLTRSSQCTLTDRQTAEHRAVPIDDTNEAQWPTARCTSGLTISTSRTGSHEVRFFPFLNDKEEERGRNVSSFLSSFSLPETERRARRDITDCEVIRRAPSRSRDNGRTKKRGHVNACEALRGVRHCVRSHELALSLSRANSRRNHPTRLTKTD